MNCPFIGDGFLITEELNLVGHMRDLEVEAQPIACGALGDDETNYEGW